MEYWRKAERKEEKWLKTEKTNKEDWKKIEEWKKKTEAKKKVLHVAFFFTNLTKENWRKNEGKYNIRKKKENTEDWRDEEERLKEDCRLKNEEKDKQKYRNKYIAFFLLF